VDDVNDLCNEESDIESELGSNGVGFTSVMTVGRDFSTYELTAGQQGVLEELPCANLHSLLIKGRKEWIKIGESFIIIPRVKENHQFLQHLDRDCAGTSSSLISSQFKPYEDTHL
jgi:hypothetical protein